MTAQFYPFRKTNRVVDIWLLMCSALILQACQFSKKTSQRLYNEASKQQFDAVIVPGVPFENNLWSRTMKGRVYWAKHLYDKGIAKNIIFSGGAVYSPYTEAEIMALYATALGVPQTNVFTETKAEHSTENLYYSYKKARKLGFKKIALASDPFQTKMLRRFARKKVDKQLALIPFVIDTLETIEPHMTDPVINYEQALVSDFKSITEREGFWKRLRGTMGKRIDTAAYQ
jgi:uncharacterized SAM-binding protein YcdF (DUF218 family)